MRSITMLCFAMLWGAAFGADEADLSSRARAFAAKAPEPAPALGQPDIFPARLHELAAVDRSVPCADGLRSLCYDTRDRGVVYRGAREYMPHVQGLVAEGVALRHDRLILRYSFR